MGVDQQVLNSMFCLFPAVLKLFQVGGWLQRICGGNKVIIRLTKSSWAGAGTELGNIDDTSFRSNAQGQRTHSARTNKKYLAVKGNMHHTQHISLKCSNYLPIWAAGLNFLIFCPIKFRSWSGLPACHSYGRLSVFSLPTHHHPMRHSAGSRFLLSAICSPALAVFTPGPCKLRTRIFF
jgi:hypothetical protein